MRHGVAIVGAVLVVLGSVLIGYGQWTASDSQWVVPPTGWAFSPAIVAPGPLIVRWSGGVPQTTAAVFKCADSSCRVTGSPPLVSGTGSSGQLTLTIQPGATYVVAEIGSPRLLMSIEVTALTYGTTLGIGLVVAGAITAGLGVGLPPKRGAEVRTANPSAAVGSRPIPAVAGGEEPPPAPRDSN